MKLRVQRYERSQIDSPVLFIIIGRSSSKCCSWRERFAHVRTRASGGRRVTLYSSSQAGRAGAVNLKATEELSFLPVALASLLLQVEEHARRSRESRSRPKLRTSQQQ